MHQDQSLTFDRYRMDVPNEQLWQGTQLIPLTGKAFAVLRYLIEHPGQLVTKAELFAALWPGTAVSDGALTFCIVELRKALGDHAKAPRFIETVHRRGYRFIAPLRTPPPVQGSTFQVPRMQAGETSPRRGTLNMERGTSLVGRGTELAQLHDWLVKALHGERQVVFVTGEPGIGKTTVVEAFLVGIGRQVIGNRQGQSTDLSQPMPGARSLMPGVWLGWGQCIEQYGVGEPYMPILEALGRLCRAAGGEQLVTLLKRYAPSWLVQIPALLPATEFEALQRQTQGATRERMLREMGEAIEVITAERPLVLVLEDLHWSDASTLELLALLARRREPARLLVIGTYRPIDVIVQEHPLRAVKQELQLHGLCAELPLGLLSETQVAEYLAVRFDADVGARRAVPLQLAQTIHHRTDGNPLFMVTAVDDLIEQHVLVRDGDQWVLSGELATIETKVPDSLQQLITQHIERLSSEDRQVLEIASVAGMEFSAASIAAGAEIETEIVEERCAGLARRGQFLRAQGTANWSDGTVATRYTFLHALYQEVLYHRIPAGRRQRLHLRIGEREEQAYGKRVREIAAALAVHFEQGRDYHKAVLYLQLAGENAMRQSAHKEAISLLTKGLEVLQTLAETPERARQELTLQIALGAPLIATKGYAASEVEKAYNRALELCRQVGETPQLFSVLEGLFAFYVNRGEILTSHDLAEQLMRLAQSVRDPGLLLTANGLLGANLYWRGEFASARTLLEQADALYNPQQPPPVFQTADHRVDCFSYASWTLWYLGYPDQALKRSQEALALAGGLSHPYSLAFALGCAALFHLFRREEQLARERAEAVITLSTEQGFPSWLGMGIAFRGYALVQQGQIEEGLAELYRGGAVFMATGARVGQSTGLGQVAEAYGKVGRTGEGLTVLAAALAAVNKTGERFHEADLYRLQGELLLTQENQKAKGKWQKSKIETNPRPLTPDPQGEAEACFHKAIEVSRHQQAKSLELRATMSLARLWQSQGKHHAAHDMLSEIYHWFTEGFDTKDLQEAKALLDELV